MPNNFLPLDRIDAFNPQQSGGGGIAGLFSDPNFLSFLAGAGSKLDPEGVGGAIGGATQGWIQAKQTGKALEKKDAQTERLIEAMAGGKIGGATVKPDGTMTLKASERGPLTQGTLGDDIQAAKSNWAENLQVKAQTDPAAASQLALFKSLYNLQRMLGLGGQ